MSTMRSPRLPSAGVAKSLPGPNERYWSERQDRAPADREQRNAPVTAVNLASFDLNLLVPLEALLDQCNVTRAADRVGLSQPAVSRALSRLRGLFDDDLLVRSGRGLVRTAKGDELNERVGPALDAIRALLGPRSVRQSGRRQMFRIAIADHQAAVLLPPLLRRIDERGSLVDLSTTPLTSNVLDELESGRIDCAIGQVSCTQAGFYRRTLYVDEYCCLVGYGHEARGQTGREKPFLGLRHVVAADDATDQLHDIRHAVLGMIPDRGRVTAPNTTSAAIMAATTDLVLTVPRRAAETLSAMLPLMRLSAPVDLPPYEVGLLWHERNHRSTEHGWIRAELAAVAERLGANVTTGG